MFYMSIFIMAWSAYSAYWFGNRGVIVMSVIWTIMFLYALLVAIDMFPVQTTITEYQVNMPRYAT